ncbi:hypothetical protein ACFWNK_37045 [Streptomyces sp. NPDC058417]|uniref:hypothetical protein n=1 Tax=unclassified Streptomyces TaxID=2593676 RepID=UPI0036499833
MTTRRQLGTGPAPAVVPADETSPPPRLLPVERIEEHDQEDAAVAVPAGTATGRRPLGEGPTAG